MNKGERLLKTLDEWRDTSSLVEDDMIRALKISVEAIEDMHECDKLLSGCWACETIHRIEKELDL